MLPALSQYNFGMFVITTLALLVLIVLMEVTNLKLDACSTILSIVSMFFLV